MEKIWKHKSECINLFSVNASQEEGQQCFNSLVPPQILSVTVPALSPQQGVALDPLKAFESSSFPKVPGFWQCRHPEANLILIKLSKNILTKTEKRPINHTLCHTPVYSRFGCYCPCVYWQMPTYTSSPYMPKHLLAEFLPQMKIYFHSLVVLWLHVQGL